MTDVDPDQPDPASSGDATSSVEPSGAGRGRLLSIAGWTVLGLVVLGAAWIVVTGLIARSHLNDARSELRDLRAAVVAGDTTKATHLVDDIRSNTDTAHSMTTGPAWWVGSNLPVLGAPLRTSRTIARQSARLGDDVLPGVLQLADDLPASRATSSVDLATIAKSAPELQRASQTARSATQTLEDTSGSWLPYVSSARDSVVGDLRQLDGELTGANRAVQILLPMLGQHGQQRYFIGFVNEAESRGGGGIPGAFAIATVDNGHISFEHFGSDDDLRGVRADVDLDPDLVARYGADDPTGTIQNSNLTPDFSVTGRIWAGMWEAKTGEHVDGALSIDPTALSYLLQVTGPARLTGGATVTAADVIALTQQKQYTLYPGTSSAASKERKAYLTSLAKAVSVRLADGGSPTRMVKALSHAARERRLVIWSGQPAIETKLRTARWAGKLGNDRGTPYSGFVVNNAAGSKLDYYLNRSMTYRRSACGSGGHAIATMTLTNEAPRSGLPAYVTIRADGPPAGAKPGDNRVLLTYYAARTARIVSVTVDGQSTRFVAQPEDDTVAVTLTLELPIGTARRIAVTVAEPQTSRPVEVLRQPLVRPLQVDLSGDTCH